MKKLLDEGRVVQTRKGAVPKLKRYLDEMPGVELQDIWDDIHPVKNSKERVGYPTQKPVRLLERIIQACTNEGDTILDPFCGCGTTIAAAQKLGRNWIGIDSSLGACRKVQQRLNAIGVVSRVVRSGSLRNHQ
jgi:site-specific DNA-methyltransferase (adenine-specific)